MNRLTHINITDMLEIIRRVNPIKILDISIDFGRWGILCRELLERDVAGMLRTPENWNLKIDGVEYIDKQTLHNYHDIFYDNIFRQNIHEFLKKHVDLYDITIFSNILEYEGKDTGISMINNAMEISRFILIYVPLDRKINGLEFENGFLSTWNEGDFSNYNVINNIILKDKEGNNYGIFLLECSSVKRIFQKNVVIYGTGDYFEYSVKPFIDNNKLICFMEENVFKQGLFFMDKMVYSIKGIKKIQDEFIIVIASIFYRDIKKKLEAAYLYNFI